MKRWKEIFTGTDRKLLETLGVGRKQEYGKNPALLIVDVMIMTLGTTRQPLLEAIKEYRLSCGEAGWEALSHIQRLLETCRASHIPVIYIQHDSRTCQLSGMEVAKSWKSGQADDDAKAHEMPDSIAPLPSELVILKTKASAFFQTPLHSCLQTMGIDTLLVVGATTSGCLRASVVDAFSYGHKCFVVEECTYDRFELSHLVNLFDMNAKYASVIPAEEAIKYVTEVGQSE
ncbi:isochorismatase family protein [Chloroflexota bacterium]